MSSAPLAKITVNVAKPLAQSAKSVRRAASFPAAETTILTNLDTQILRRDDSVPATIHIKVDNFNRAVVLGRRGAAALLVCLLQVVIQEAPAWAVSMVVHMVTLVTMAMVTTAQPLPYKAQHLVVTPPDEEKVEDLLDVAETSPAALDEKAPVDATAFVSKIEQRGTSIQGGDDLGMAGSGVGVGSGVGDGAGDEAAAIETSGLGVYAQPSDVLSAVGVEYAGNMSQGGAGPAQRVRLVPAVGPNEASEKAVARALKWLANHQLADGGWSFNHASCETCRGACRNPGRLEGARNAATALALLPFLGSGQTHKDSKRYKSAINGGLNYLIGHMRIGPHGGALNEPGGNMYSHGIAAIALCEAYAMTHDKKLLVPAGAAINFICFAQDPSGGGWRYQPHDRGDTSMLGWQVMALKSGYMAGLTVPPNTVHKASQFLDSVQGADGATYGYLNANGRDATTAIGLLCRMYLGWKKDNPMLQRGIQWLAKRGPSANNMYYNYYATQVMRHWEGEEWKKWNSAMRDQLIHTQARQGHEDGSWFISGGDLGAIAGGRLYCTAMAAMILEVYHRYMPIYGSQSVEEDFPE